MTEKSGPPIFSLDFTFRGNRSKRLVNKKLIYFVLVAIAIVVGGVAAWNWKGGSKTIQVSEPNELIYSDFDEEKLTTNVGGSIGTMSSEGASDPTVGFTSGQVGSALSIDYGFSSNSDQWCGVWSYFKSDETGYDLSDYTHLKMWVKGKSGGETFKVELEDTSGGMGVIYPSEIGFSVTSEWQELSIPLDSFREVDWTSAADLNSVSQVKIVFDTSPYSGTLYVDEMKFVQLSEGGTFATPAEGLSLGWKNIRTNEGGISTTWSNLTENEKELLKDIQKNSFDYFWNEANPETGLVPDRLTESGVSSIASVGFALSSICIAEERGWVGYEDAYDRVLTTLNSFYDDPNDPNDLVVEGSHGFFRHWVNIETGERKWNSEISLIDTSLLMAGVLHAGQHFEGTEIETLADELYRAVEWDWMQTDSTMKTWTGYNEYILSYILALGSPTHPISADGWDGYASGYGWTSYTGSKFLTVGGSFVPQAYLYQFPACWIDFRNKQDEYANYYQNAMRALKANRNYCLDKNEEKGFADNLWGWTACDGKSGYRGYGKPYNGTVSPSAVAASVPFIPNKAIDALQYMYDEYSSEAWGQYGFVNSFNPTEDWYDEDYIGIDKGNTVLLLEDFRSGQVWNEFMEIPYIQNALNKAGFKEGFRIDDRGFIRDWLIVGPFGDNYVKSYETNYIGENSIGTPQAGDKANGKTWKEHHSPIGPSSANLIDLYRIFDSRKGKSAYAYTNLVSEESKTVDLRVGSDDSIKVWINNELVHSKKAERGAREDQDIIEEVQLDAGSNKILVKVSNEVGGWGFYLRFTKS